MDENRHRNEKMGVQLNNQKQKLLLVDDDTFILAITRKELVDAGYDVVVADSAKEGLKAAANEQPFDLAILDISMPGMSGIDMTPALRELGIPWIFLSAFDDKETVDIASDAGALGYLVKPTSMAKALPTIVSAIKRSKDIDRYIESEARLSGALETGSQVNVAIGILMERQKIGRQDAFELIRSKARSEQRKVKDVAEEILAAWHSLNLLPNNKS